MQCVRGVISIRAGRGFTLIELLVAVLIAATVVLGFAGGTLAVMRANRVGDKHSEAASVAQSVLANLRAGRTPGSVNGFDVAWSLFTPDAADVPANTDPSRMTGFLVTISWTSPHAGSFSFRTVVDN